MDSLLSFWGDTASIGALVLTAIGFTITIIGVRRSTSASIRAREAAEGVLHVVERFDTVTELTSTVSEIKEVMRLQRDRAWRNLPDRYMDIRRRLSVVLHSDTMMGDEHRKIILESSKVFDRNYRIVELALFEGGEPPKPEKMNISLSVELSSLEGVLLQLRNIQRKVNDG